MSGKLIIWYQIMEGTDCYLFYSTRDINKHDTNPKKTLRDLNLNDVTYRDPHYGRQLLSM